MRYLYQERLTGWATVATFNSLADTLAWHSANGPGAASSRSVRALDTLARTVEELEVCLPPTARQLTERVTATELRRKDPRGKASLAVTF